MLYEIGKILTIIGILIFIIGILFFLMGKYGFLPRLPGDILIKRENFIFYFPIATSIILSILLTIVFNLFRRR
uniref:DUF2905 domain-containing protein n=1 Tax=candidate division WOR-3 bacterium TaxID=2052148 RepID=A0A7C4YG63_UNCW3